MIIAFEGTKENRNGADACMVFTAAMTMFQRQKKVIMLSIGNRESSRDLEMLADSAAKTERDLSDSLAGTVTFEDTGIDAILRQASTSRLTENHFTDYTTQYARAKNYLDIAPMTTQRDFETLLEVHPEDIETMLSNANEVYDYVFVYLDADNDKLTDLALKYVDRIVTVVAQGPSEKLAGVTAPADKALKKKRWYLVVDADRESTYGFRYMKKAYDSDNIYSFPHNVLLKDAVSDGRLIHFASLNSQVKRQDTNYVLCESVKRLMDSVTGVKANEELAESLEKLEKMRRETPQQVRLEEIPENKLEVEEKTRKHGIFGKTYTDKKVYAVSDEAHEYTDVTPVDDSAKPFMAETEELSVHEDKATVADAEKPVEAVDELLQDAATPAAEPVEEAAPAEEPETEEKPVEKPSEKKKHMGIFEFFAKKETKAETPATETSVSDAGEDTMSDDTANSVEEDVLPVEDKTEDTVQEETAQIETEEEVKAEDVADITSFFAPDKTDVPEAEEKTEDAEETTSVEGTNESPENADVSASETADEEESFDDIPSPEEIEKADAEKAAEEKPAKKQGFFSRLFHKEKKETTVEPAEPAAETAEQTDETAVDETESGDILSSEETASDEDTKPDETDTWAFDNDGEDFKTPEDPDNE